jgi:hypothetical protein
MCCAIPSHPSVPYVSRRDKNILHITIALNEYTEAMDTPTSTGRAMANGWDTGGAGTVADPGTHASGPSSGTGAWRSDASAFPASHGPAMAGRYMWDVVHRLWGAPCTPTPVVCRHLALFDLQTRQKPACCSLTCGYTLFGRPPRAIFAVENPESPRGGMRGTLCVRVRTDLRSAVSALLVSCALGDIRHELPRLFPRYGGANLNRPVICCNHHRQRPQPAAGAAPVRTAAVL